MHLFPLVAAAVLLACNPAPGATTSPDDPATPPTAATPSPATGTEDLRAAFGIDRVDTACRAFEVHATDPARTRMLDIDVDGEALGLTAGTHTLTVGTKPEVRVALDEFAAPVDGELHCTDAGMPNPPKPTMQWHATSGTLIVKLSATAKANNDPLVVDVELVDVRLTSSTGMTKTVRGSFANLRVGWLPG